jgi:hypothetical protein
LGFHWLIHQQSQDASIAAAGGSELAAYVESTTMPSCCFPIPPVPTWVAEIAFGLVRASKQTRDRTTLAVVAALHTVAADVLDAADESNSGSD